jgi:hypothetical protein
MSIYYFYACMKANPCFNERMLADTIQSMGGKARKVALTAEQRTEIAKQAAEARWAARAIQATHKGNLKEEFGIDVDCYVLDDPQKTAVLSERGMGRALGLSSTGGNKLRTFLGTKAMSALVGPELRQKLSQPVKFQWGTGGLELPPTVVHGFDATLLIDLCRVIIQAEADGAFGERNARVRAQGHVIAERVGQIWNQGTRIRLGWLQPNR